MIWEYKRVMLDFYLGTDREGEDEPLNELGKQEWEVFHIQEAGKDGRELVAYCKRPVKEKKKTMDKKEVIDELISRLIKGRNHASR